MSSLFLVNCSSSDDDSGDKSGTGGTSTLMAGTGGSAAGTGGSGGSTSVAGTGTGGSSAGMANSGGTVGKAGTTGMAGQGGAAAGTSAGGGAGKGTAGGAPMAGSGPSGGAGGSAGMSAGMSGAASGAGGKAAGGAAGGSSTGMMTLTSSVLTEGGMFPDGITCAGANKSPDLTWTAGPSGTMSYAVTLFDTSNMLTHWAMWDIPANVTMLPAALDTMASSTTVPGAKQKAYTGNGYTGPCPNGMDHVYKFIVYALPVATLTGSTSSQTAASTSIMAAGPLGSASLSAHSSAKMP